MLIHHFRFYYRKLLLFFLPARAYVLRCGISQSEMSEQLAHVIHPDKLYFIRPNKSGKPYTGKFDVNTFTAIKNSKSSWQRPIKVRGIFYMRQQQVYVRLIMSNPFSIINILQLILLYLVLLLFLTFPFERWWQNSLLYLFPIAFMYIFTNISFQANYRKEKTRFFKLFKGRRISELEAEKLGM